MTYTIEPIRIYHEGQLDKRYWYTTQAMQYVRKQATRVIHRTDLIFEQHRLTYN